MPEGFFVGQVVDFLLRGKRYVGIISSPESRSGAVWVEWQGVRPQSDAAHNWVKSELLRRLTEPK